MHVCKGVFGAIMLGLGSTLGTGVFVSIRIGAGVTGPAVIIIIILAALLAAWLRPGVRRGRTRSCIPLRPVAFSCPIHKNLTNASTCLSKVRI